VGLRAEGGADASCGTHPVRAVRLCRGSRDQVGMGIRVWPDVGGRKATGNIVALACQGVSDKVQGRQLMAVACLTVWGRKSGCAPRHS
jgi:hypothetical protein